MKTYTFLSGIPSENYKYTPEIAAQIEQHIKDGHAVFDGRYWIYSDGHRKFLGCRKSDGSYDATSQDGELYIFALPIVTISEKQLEELGLFAGNSPYSLSLCYVDTNPSKALSADGAKTRADSSMSTKLD